jgi:glycine/D-amino acid oxidase-like deaminating enzyme
MERGRRSFRVIVVGGGIIGCASAAELAARGAHVTLLERESLAAGASGRNHGLLLTPLDPALAPMAQVSASAYDELAHRTNVPFRLDRGRIGFLLVAGDDEGEGTAGRDEAAAAEECGVDVTSLGASDIRRLEPALAPDLVEGWLLDDGRRLDPGALTVALALRAREAGAEILTGTVARSVVVKGDTVRGVVTDAGLLGCDLVVLASGPWIQMLLRTVGVKLPVTGGRGWLVHLAPTRPVVSRLVSRAGWHVVPPGNEPVAPIIAADLVERSPEADTGTLLQPNADGTLLVGGSRQAVLTAEPEDPSVAHRLIREAVRLAPVVSEAPVLGAWWGIRPMTPDGRPVVGAVRPGLVVAGGHGSVGVILGAGTGKLVAAIALDDTPPFDPAPFDPTRFG